MKNELYKQIIKAVETIKQNSNERYLILTEECYESNKEKLSEFGLLESDIKIYKIPDEMNSDKCEKMVDELSKKHDR
jgi:hypothetical protein